MPVSRQAAPSEGGGRCRAQLYGVAARRSQQRGRPLSGTKVSARALRKRGCRAPGDLTPYLNGDVFLGDITGTRIRSLQLQPLRRASASDGVHRTSAGSERGTCTCGRAHRARARRNLRSAFRAHRARARRYLRSVGSCGEVSHSSSIRVRRASGSDGGHCASASSDTWGRAHRARACCCLRGAGSCGGALLQLQPCTPRQRQ